MENNDFKIKIGQIWRNKEKNYTIEVISKIKKDTWKVSAHGRGSTTHGMTESSFHFYDLVNQDNDVELTEEESMNITEAIRHLYNEEIEVNSIFSVKDIVDITIKNIDESIDKEKILNVANSFIHRCVKENIIKKQSDKKKNSITKKIFQKIQNTVHVHEKNTRSDIKINEKHFIKSFNIIENSQTFDSIIFYNQVIMNTGCENSEEDIKSIIRSRVYKFIADCVEKGYIKREGKRYSTLTKIKNIEDGFSSKEKSVEVIETKEETSAEVIETKIEEEKPVEVIEITDTEVKETSTENSFIENEKEIKEKLDNLTKKFKDLELKDLIETGIKFFNILLEKDTLHNSIISRFKSEISELKQDQENLIKSVNNRNKTIVSTTKMIRLLNKEILKFDKDLEFQLEENEKLKLKNTDLQNKNVQLEQKIKDLVPEETEAWKSIKLHEVMNMN